MNNLDYGVVGNCKTAALISRYGSVDWMCLPQFDSPSVFCKLLDEEKGGSLHLRVAEDYHIAQYYIKGTNILCTSFKAEEGSFELVDFMPRYRTIDANYYIPSELYRYFRRITGKPRLRIVYDPRMNYAGEPVEHWLGEDYIKTYSQVNKKDSIYLYSSFNPQTILKSEEIVLQEEAYLLLSANQKLVTIDTERVYLEYERTKIYWFNWNNRSRQFSTFNDAISRSLLVLKLMTYQDSGAVLAALTTSLPETIGKERNWDYRFCWIRDASMSMETLLKMGHRSAAQGFMGFVKRILRTKSEEFQLMYSIDGDRILTEKTLPYLSGYRNSRPVRIGNAAYDQKQNDFLGYLMDVMYQYYIFFPGSLNELEEMWEIVKSIVLTVYSQWREPDQSIWEFRGRKENFVFSKVMCWVALDRAIQIARFLEKSDHEQEWQKEADAIKEDVWLHGWNEELQSFTQAYDNTYMDSSLLLMEYYGFLKPDDEKFVKTVRRVRKELFHNGLMYRYKDVDDFGLPSSSFTICTFWLIRALFVTGEKEEALRIFHEVLTHANHVGLFSEDMDFRTKRLLGNFPQAYSHLSLINTALLFAQEKTYKHFMVP
ncbi:MAG: glycoside hydrolase family 15 protein [Bacteroides sp.]|nr:glycoside hydrolase family 15 protein [Bacteroides sp.]